MTGSVRRPVVSGLTVSGLAQIAAGAATGFAYAAVVYRPEAWTGSACGRLAGSSSSTLTS